MVSGMDLTTFYAYGGRITYLRLGHHMTPKTTVALVATVANQAL